MAWRGLSPLVALPESGCSLVRRGMSTKKSVVERYIQRQSKDVYCWKASMHSYRARSAFKLLQIHEKYKILKPGEVVLDFGAAPGSWCQVVAEVISPREVLRLFPGEKPGGYILGIDLQEIEPIEGVDLLCRADVTKPNSIREINRRLDGRPVNVVLSDMAPDPSGSYYSDHLRLITLCRCLLKLFTPHSTSHPASKEDSPKISLAPNARFLCKIWDGAEREKFVAELAQKFEFVKAHKPDASRKQSSEIYLLARGYRERAGDK